ncbi:hypothetical protein CRE_00008 [Caenorhabditis remanei]|uniref:Uncharacterized protein n=1 Tax=Caenorhabditis remanei TaxID=31234 RepID=E3LCA4_CAERE|nr:hypothetical protein CRE_00008 [Caenorhabditis remanei]
MISKCTMIPGVENINDILNTDEIYSLLVSNRLSTECHGHNWKKTKKTTITPVVSAEEYVYLGRLLNMNNYLEPEIRRRRRGAYAAFNNIKNKTDRCFAMPKNPSPAF